MARRDKINGRADRGRAPGRHRPQQGHRGSRPVRSEEHKRRGGGCLLPLLGLLLLAAVIVVLFLLLRGDDDSSTDSTTPAGETTSSVSQSADGGAPSAGASASGGEAAGTVDAGGTALLPVPQSGLAAYSGQDVTGTSVPVESVVSDEGFWVGESQQDRVFVQLDVSGESPFKVTAGQTVSFAGVLRELSGDPLTVGVTDPEGASMLKQQGQYIVASQLQEG